MIPTSDNIKVLRKYSDWLYKFSRFADSTAENQMSNLSIFEEFTKRIDFRSVDEDLVVRYKNSLKDIRRNGKPHALKTTQDRLKSVKLFFVWLKKRPGYKIKIKNSVIDCFELKMSEKNTINTQRNLSESQSISAIKNIVVSIKNEYEVDKRDKGLISFLIMTAIRVQSLIRLRIRDIDINRLIVTLNPADGVPTKFGKAFKVVFMVWDEEFLNFFLDWYEYLINVKKYGPDDPLFPVTDIKFDEDYNQFYATDVKPAFWANTGQINEVLKRRSKDAGLQYFNPHSYRNTIKNEYTAFNPTLQQAAALSQNLGHSTIHITETYYGYMQPNKRLDILTEFFSNGIGNTSLEDRIESLEKKVDESFAEILHRLPKRKANNKMKQNQQTKGVNKNEG